MVSWRRECEMMSEEEADDEMEMALKTVVGGPYISRAAAGKEPQLIQVRCELLQLEAMGEAFCMSVRGYVYSAHT